jgi:hypothetical protein
MAVQNIKTKADEEVGIRKFTSGLKNSVYMAKLTYWKEKRL